MQVAKLLNYQGTKYQVAIRPGTSDEYTAHEILRNRCYELHREPVSPVAMKNFDPKFIIDGGANAGYASVFFANRYPNAKIVAVEPEAQNIEMMEYNLQNYPQVKIIHAALWNRETELAIDDSYRSTSHSFKNFDAFMMNEFSNDNPPPPQKHTPGITIEKIFTDSGFKYIDILKLDIEGSEKELFSENSNYQSWLPYVKVLMIELHDRMRKDCSYNFFRAMSWYRYFFMLIGENLIFIREDLL